VWAVIAYTPPVRVAFLIAKGNDAVERLSIELRAINNRKTEIEWSVLGTAYSKTGHKKEQLGQRREIFEISRRSKKGIKLLSRARHHDTSIVASGIERRKTNGCSIA
jgi:hypothetical protein